eukprot:gb/GEZJ01006660.1/.p2 GENE.gb/GEZJ01006660.1/~~gb/GEZJ01006660.1/.p2  ORF type:complete len:100 (+),score=6.47 gb/GEZJ01006660.1/:813-1112(+)
MLDSSQSSLGERVSQYAGPVAKVKENSPFGIKVVDSSKKFRSTGWRVVATKSRTRLGTTPSSLFNLSLFFLLDCISHRFFFSAPTPSFFTPFFLPSFHL